MANTYFQFKQFRITQQRGAMKVCTDACLQGAYAAHYVLQHMDYPQRASQELFRVLDLGAGTGLLTLMLAQALPGAALDAIELEAEACVQARDNFEASPWRGRMRLLQTDIRGYKASTKYPFILSNPPFYQKQLKGKEAAKNGAKHDTTLRHDQLLDTVLRQLTSHGTFCVMLPADGFEVFRIQARGLGLYPVRMLSVRQTPHHDFFRRIGFFQFTAERLQEEVLSITDQSGQYSPDFQDLLRPYYLHL